jgi:hypothetical protein
VKSGALRIAWGIWRLATFNADGFAAFAPTAQGLLNSFAPLLALPLIGFATQMAKGEWHYAISDMLVTIVAVLMPLVVSEAFARRWGRQARWARFAVATNWCQWAVPMLLLLLALLLSCLALLGLEVSQTAAGAAVIVLVCYGLALHWFLARRGLDVSRGQATLLVLVADLLTGLFVIGPRVLAASL